MISHDTYFCELYDCPEKMRRTVVSRCFTRYGGDPVGLMTLQGWTFPGLPDVEPSLLGLTYLYEDDSLSHFHVFHSSRSTCRGRVRTSSWMALCRKSRTTPKMLSVISNQNPVTLARKEAWQPARTIGKDIATKTSWPRRYRLLDCGIIIVLTQLGPC